jgi:hypothetical protein
LASEAKGRWFDPSQPHHLTFFTVSLPPCPRALTASSGYPFSLL